ncbi:MAG TPA: hypothetical protein VGI81_05575 [Tepidisphaeraceae bacterium]
MNRSTRLAIGVLGLVCCCAVRAHALDVDRASYKITLPEGATVEKGDGEIDADHMTTVNLPNDSTMVVLVIDDKARASVAFDKMVNEYKSKVKEGSVDKSESFVQPKATRANAVTGRLNGVLITFDVGQIDGKEKSFLVVFTYMQSKKAATIEMVQKAMTTFVIKE